MHRKRVFVVLVSQVLFLHVSFEDHPPYAKRPHMYSSWKPQPPITHPTINNDTNLNEFLRTVLNNYRLTMRMKSSILQDPILVRGIDLTETFKSIHEKLVVNSTKINPILLTGLSYYNVEEVSNNLAELQLKVVLKFDSIKLFSSYDIDAVFYKLFPFFGTGEFHLITKDLRIGFNLGLNVASATQISIHPLDVILSLRAIESLYFHGLFGLKGSDWNYVFMKIITYLGARAFNYFVPEVLKTQLKSSVVKKYTEWLTENIENLEMGQTLLDLKKKLKNHNTSKC